MCRASTTYACSHKEQDVPIECKKNRRRKNSCKQPAEAKSRNRCPKCNVRSGTGAMESTSREEGEPYVLGQDAKNESASNKDKNGETTKVFHTEVTTEPQPKDHEEGEHGENIQCWSEASNVTVKQTAPVWTSQVTEEQSKVAPPVLEQPDLNSQFSNHSLIEDKHAPDPNTKQESATPETTSSIAPIVYELLVQLLSHVLKDSIDLKSKTKEEQNQENKLDRTTIDFETVYSDLSTEACLSMHTAATIQTLQAVELPADAEPPARRSSSSNCDDPGSYTNQQHSHHGFLLPGGYSLEWN